MLALEAQATTVGILYPGELGAALGRLLIENGARVVTTLGGRSARTRGFSEAAGFSELNSLNDLVDAADIVISVVAPSAAVDVACGFAAAVCARGKGPGIYADANSVSPRTIGEIAHTVRSVGVRFCDCAIHGLAGRLRAQGTLFVSGEAARDIEGLLADALKVQYLGEKDGQASLIKMLLGGFSKVLCASFFNLAMLSQEGAMTDEFLRAFRRHYPEILTMLERLLPTYPQHVGRRSEEMAELAETISSVGLPTWFADAARQTFEYLAMSGLKESWQEATRTGRPDTDRESLRRLIALVHSRDPCQVPKFAENASFAENTVANHGFC